MKFFYQFNLRDLSKVTEGVMMSQHSFYKKDIVTMYSLWAHECRRTVEDRLINQEDIG